MLQFGVIGCGYIAKKHINTISQFHDMSLIAVSDIKQQKMEEVTKDYDENPISFYQDYKYMLADPRVDVVVIATISSLHAEMAKNALNNHKHVIIEKPLALSLTDANEIIYLAQKHQKQVLVCHQLRYRPIIKKIKELITKGYFGEIHFGAITLMLNRSPEYYCEASWKGTWEHDGGMLINQGIHLVDLLIWMMGDIQSVYGEIATTFERKQTEDIALGMINFENGAKGLINANTITKPENIGYYFSLFGEKGSIRIGGKKFNQIKHCYIEDLPDIKKELASLCSDLDEHVFMYKNFYESITNGKKVLMSAKEGKKALEGIFSLVKIINQFICQLKTFLQQICLRIIEHLM